MDNAQIISAFINTTAVACAAVAAIASAVKSIEEAKSLKAKRQTEAKDSATTSAANATDTTATDIRQNSSRRLERGVGLAVTLMAALSLVFMMFSSHGAQPITTADAAMIAMTVVNWMWGISMIRAPTQP